MGVGTDRHAEIGAARESIDWVPNGIDVERTQSAPLPETHGHDAYDILFVSRLIEDKNVALLLDAFDTMASRTDAELGIIGDGLEVDRLQQQARRLDHVDRIDFLGFLNEYDHVLGHMRAARVFASPPTRKGSEPPVPKRWPPTVP